MSNSNARALKISIDPRGEEHDGPVEFAAIGMGADGSLLGACWEICYAHTGSERAWEVVIGRKNYYGSRSGRGTEVAAIYYTLVESAKRVGVSPRAYIEAAVETALSKAGAVLLPDEFKRQLEAARHLPLTKVS